MFKALWVYSTEDQLSSIKHWKSVYLERNKWNSVHSLISIKSQDFLVELTVWKKNLTCFWVDILSEGRYLKIRAEEMTSSSNRNWVIDPPLYSELQSPLILCICFSFCLSLCLSLFPHCKFNSTKISLLHRSLHYTHPPSLTRSGLHWYVSHYPMCLFFIQIFKLQFYIYFVTVLLRCLSHKWRRCEGRNHVYFTHHHILSI